MEWASSDTGTGDCTRILTKVGGGWWPDPANCKRRSMREGERERETLSWVALGDGIWSRPHWWRKGKGSLD